MFEKKEKKNEATNYDAKSGKKNYYPFGYPRFTAKPSTPIEASERNEGFKGCAPK